MSVLVWIEQNQNGVVPNSLEVLGKAKEIAAALGTQTVAAVSTAVAPTSFTALRSAAV